MYQRPIEPDSSQIHAALLARGWTRYDPLTTGSGYYHRAPGLVLLLNYSQTSEKWTCAIRSSLHILGVPSDPAPPVFKGRGAKAAANKFMVDLVNEHRGWLADVGVDLRVVSCTRWLPSGRGGRYSEIDEVYVHKMAEFREPAGATH